MAKIHEKKNIEKESPFQSSKLINKDDMKTTFGYLIFTSTVILAAWGLAKSFIKQINKD